MEQTASDLQAQIDRLSVALHQWRDAQDQLQPMEQRLSELTERCAEILNRWSDIDQRHAQAVRDVEEKLGQWSVIETRLERDSAERLRQLESAVEHDWKTLREMHEEPVRQLREQAAALGETCMAAANLALRGFERAEARFAALEASIQDRIGQLSVEVQTALTEVRRNAGIAQIGAAPAPFSLDGVMKIHDEMRGTDSSSPELSARPAETLVASVPRALPAAQPLSAESSTALLNRVESLEREVTTEKQEVRDTATLAERLRRDWRLGVAVVAVLLIALAFLGLRLQRQVTARLDAAANRVAAAERQAVIAENATKQLTATRADAERQLAEARETALRAQIVTNVLAAPDLRRFNLRSPDPASRAYAQVLWSRSRGLVLSAARLGAAPAKSAYQIWFVTQTRPVSGGTFVPDATGQVTLAVANPPNIPVPVTDVLVTLEPAGGSATPSGTTVLARPQQQ